MSNIYLAVRLGLCVLGKKATEVKFHLHHIVSRALTGDRLTTVDVDLDPGYSSVRRVSPLQSWLSSPHRMPHPLEGSQSAQPTPKESRYAPPP